MDLTPVSILKPVMMMVFVIDMKIITKRGSIRCEESPWLASVQYPIFSDDGLRTCKGSLEVGAETRSGDASRRAFKR